VHAMCGHFVRQSTFFLDKAGKFTIMSISSVEIVLALRGK